MKQQISILGVGWLGLPLAERLTSVYNVRGSVSTLEKLDTLSNMPFAVQRIKLTPDSILGDWEAFIHRTDVLIVNFPPRRVDNIQELYPVLAKQITLNTPKTVKVVFVSSTSVYQGTKDVVTEDLVCEPDKISGKAVLQAEKVLQDYFGKNLTILRLAGLIGPKRHPGRFLANKRTLKNPDVPVNLIHQEDAIGLIEQIIKLECFGETINGCADEHPMRVDFYTKAAQELCLPEPNFTSSVDQDWKIVNNAKSKTLLTYKYLYSNPEFIFTQKKRGKISIIGAGPGDPSLLTVKAEELLSKADIVLHDNLISADILDLASDADKIYVGRKYGDTLDQYDRQQRINKLLEEHFIKGDKVVRLKSGDPYVFGRAAEEARYLVDRKIPFEVVPGISAALAGANRFNLPITERRKSSSLLICTAHTADYSYDQLKGIAELLNDGNSLAIYMGLKSLDKLIPKLIEVTSDPDIPISAISNVSREDEKMISSTLENIRTELKENPLPMPVVFIVGVKPIKKEI